MTYGGLQQLQQLLNGIYKFCDFMISQIFEVMKLTLCSFKNLVNKNLFSAMLVRIFCENVFDYIWFQIPFKK